MQAREMETKTNVMNKTDEGINGVECQAEKAKEKYKDTNRMVACTNTELLRL